MKVGFISDFSMLGGLNTHLTGLMSHARAKGWQVYALLDEGTAGSQVARALRGSNHSVETAGLYWRIHSEIAIRRSVDQWLARVRPDVIHLHDGSPRSNLFAKEAGVASGIPTYASVHFVPLDLEVNRGQFDRMKPAFASLTGLILNSRYGAELLQSHGLTCENQTWIHYGVSMKKKMARSTEYESGCYCRILAITRGESRKGLVTLLDIFSELIKEGNSSFQLTLAGDYRRHEILPVLARMGIPESMVNLIGWQDDMCSCYGSHDLLVLCSTEEGTPISLLEALATGLPVMASRLAGTLELLAESDCCELLPVNDPHTWRVAIRSFVRDPRPLALRAVQGAELVREKHSSPQQLGKVLQFIQWRSKLRNDTRCAESEGEMLCP